MFFSYCTVWDVIANASPAHALHLASPNQTEIWKDFELESPHAGLAARTLSKRGLANNVQLRIMPLGASIVNGVGSSDKNGFRYALRNKLIWEGNPVNMIGSQNAGNMADGSCECYPGDKYGCSAHLLLSHTDILESTKSRRSLNRPGTTNPILF